jgi:hypothetical protein
MEENRNLSDLEGRMVEKMCSLLGELIEAQSAGDNRAFVTVQRRFQDLGEVAGSQLFRVFAQEAIERIRDASPEAAKKILDRLSRKSSFADEPPLGEQGRGQHV